MWRTYDGELILQFLDFESVIGVLSFVDISYMSLDFARPRDVNGL